jgi:hypothetical protein
LLVTNEPVKEPAVTGCDYDIIRDVPGQDLQVRLLGAPGTEANVKLPSGETSVVTFAGTPLREKCHRKIGDLEEISVPEDAGSLYEATCFAADNNALEYRELERSGPTEIDAVQSARDAFFNQPVLRRRHLSDRFLFDDDPQTAFATSRRWGDIHVQGGGFRLDLGRPTLIDRLVLEVGDDYNLQPLKSEEGVWGATSEDLRIWTPQRFWCNDQISAHFSPVHPIRYVTINGCPDLVRHVRGYLRGKALDRTGWRASNLFASSEMAPVVRAWAHDFQLSEIPPGSYLAIAIEGIHGIEKGYAALRVAEGYAGANRRSPSFPSNTWECPVRMTDRNTTYFIPLTQDMLGKPLQAVALLIGNRRWAWDQVTVPDVELAPTVWITAYPDPFVSLDITIRR